MWKKKERWTAAALLLAMVVVTGLCWYILYIRQQFYDEGTRNLLETYEQVDKSFSIFSRSNWNMLNEWGKSLQAANEEGLAEERLRSYEAEREIWRYSSVYLFNENCEYWSIRGKHEKWITSGRPLRRCTVPASLRCPATSCGAGSAGWYTLRPLRRWRSTAPPTPALP